MKLSNNKKRQLQQLVAQASQAMAQQQQAVFEQLCQKVESIQPNNADIANLRAIALSKVGQAAEAEKQFVAAINAAPKRGDFHHNLAQLYWAQGLYPEALERWRAVLRLEPYNTQAAIGAGSCLIKLRQPEKSLPILEQAKKRAKNKPDLLMALATAYYDLHRFDEARQQLQTVLSHQPGHAAAHLQMAQVLIESGRIPEGLEETKKVITLQPNLSAAHVLLAVSSRQHDESDINQLKSLYMKSPENSPERVQLGFALGKVMNELHQHEQAFSYLQKANSIRHQHSAFDQQQALSEMRDIMRAYTPATLEHTSGTEDASPIFIVGMPRCGSSLVEQILAAHPEVSSKGECEYFEKAFNENHASGLQITQPDSITPEQWRSIGSHYLKLLRSNDESSKHTTDKSLTNTRLIGAIHCALPKAKIIHVRRHPLDVCWSIYKTNLLGMQLDYGRNLECLGHYYRAYLQLMQHWRNTLPTGVMHELDYESLIQNQEGETRKLLAHCELDWSDHCMAFHSANNVVRTASQIQVRQPIYTDSVASWKPYQSYLQPLIDILGPENSTEYKGVQAQA